MIFPFFLFYILCGIFLWVPEWKEATFNKFVKTYAISCDILIAIKSKRRGMEGYYGSDKGYYFNRG